LGGGLSILLLLIETRRLCSPEHASLLSHPCRGHRSAVFTCRNEAHRYDDFRTSQESRTRPAIGHLNTVFVFFDPPQTAVNSYSSSPRRMSVRFAPSIVDLAAWQVLSPWRLRERLAIGRVPKNLIPVRNQQIIVQGLWSSI
jgi:hypothetical protein